MDAIKKQEFARIFGVGKWLDIVEHAFNTGWKTCEEWHEEQEQMSKDSLEQTREEAKLAGGLG